MLYWTHLFLMYRSLVKVFLSSSFITSIVGTHSFVSSFTIPKSCFWVLSASLYFITFLLDVIQLIVFHTMEEAFVQSRPFVLVSYHFGSLSILCKIKGLLSDPWLFSLFFRGMYFLAALWTVYFKCSQSSFGVCSSSVSLSSSWNLFLTSTLNWVGILSTSFPAGVVLPLRTFSFSFILAVSSWLSLPHSALGLVLTFWSDDRHLFLIMM